MTLGMFILGGATLAALWQTLRVLCGSADHTVKNWIALGMNWGTVLVFYVFLYVVTDWGNI